MVVVGLGGGPRQPGGHCGGPGATEGSLWEQLHQEVPGPPRALPPGYRDLWWRPSPAQQDSSPARAVWWSRKGPSSSLYIQILIDKLDRCNLSVHYAESLCTLKYDFSLMIWIRIRTFFLDPDPKLLVSDPGQAEMKKLKNFRPVFSGRRNLPKGQSVLGPLLQFYRKDRWIILRSYNSWLILRFEKLIDNNVFFTSSKCTYNNKDRNPE